MPVSFDYNYNNPAMDYEVERNMATPSIQIGDRGVEVGKLQLALNTTMGSGLQVDRIFGPQTQQVLRDFQFSDGMLASGVADQLTQTALLNAMKDRALMDRASPPVPWYMWAGALVVGWWFFTQS